MLRFNKAIVHAAIGVVVALVIAYPVAAGTGYSLKCSECDFDAFLVLASATRACGIDPASRAAYNPAATGTKGEPAVKTYRFSAVIEKDEDGYYAFCPELQGCCTSGETFEEARANLADAIRLHIEDADDIPGR